MKYALIAAIESDNKCINSDLNIVNIQRKFESEAVICFQNWRQNGGWLKDIPIYVMCPTKNVISFDTAQQLHNLGVTYIEEYHPITEQFNSGFLNIPYVGKVFEDTLDVDVTIKIDLDMNLIQPLPQALVEAGVTVCGQYDDYCTKLQRTLEPGWYNPFDTGFVISPTRLKFYTKWWDGVWEILNGAHDPDWELVKQQTGDYYLEEYVVDKLYHHDNTVLQPVQKYQIGEWYTPVSAFTDEELQSVYFWHEHLLHDPKYNKIREKVEYFNRITKIKKASR